MPPYTYPIHTKITYDYTINKNFISKIPIIIKNLVVEYIKKYKN
jgi:hypothetical protein